MKRKSDKLTQKIECIFTVEYGAQFQLKFEANAAKRIENKSNGEIDKSENAEKGNEKQRDNSVGIAMRLSQFQGVTRA